MKKNLLIIGLVIVFLVVFSLSILLIYQNSTDSNLEKNSSKTKYTLLCGKNYPMLKDKDINYVDEDGNPTDKYCNPLGPGYGY